MEHVVFLKWALLNALTAVFFVAAGYLYHSHIHGAALVAVPMLLTLFTFMTAYGGWLCWKTDLATKTYLKDRIRHDLDWLNYFAYTLQVGGIMCTLIGFYLILGHGIEANFQQKLAGGSVALLGSFVGVLCSLVLLTEQRVIEHELGG